MSNSETTTSDGQAVLSDGDNGPDVCWECQAQLVECMCGTFVCPTSGCPGYDEGH